MSTFNKISDARIDLILEILQKLAVFPDSPQKTELSKSLSEKLTITESVLFAIAFSSGVQSEAQLEEHLQKLEPLLTVYKAIGIPLHTPVERLTAAQKGAIDAGQSDMQSVTRLVKLWQNANHAA